MWWPAFEFVNTAGPAVTNRALEISPDGTVRYLLGMTSEFRANLDLRRFPFDRQTLEVRVESFLWDDGDMMFVVDPHTDRLQSREHVRRAPGDAGRLRRPVSRW